MLKRFFPWVFFSLFFGVATLGAEPVRDKHVEAELVSERPALIPGETARLGLRLKHDEHWHTYWRTPVIGIPTSIAWDLPAGFEVGELQWPAPKAYKAAGIVDYVYEGEVVLPVKVKIPRDLQVGGSVTLRARAEWLMCADVCIPGGVDLELTLPVAAEPGPVGVWGELFAQADAAMPRPPDAWNLRATRAAGTLVLEVEPKGLRHDPGELYFISGERAIQANESQPQTAGDGGAVRLMLQEAEGSKGELTRLVGVLRAANGFGPDGPQALAVDLPIGREALPAALPSMAEMLTILGFAFLGGLILNLMPCVFPVLGIKVMGFVNQAGEDRRKVTLHGLVFTVGVLLSFWVLAGLLLSLRASLGDQVGWGFQLQNATVVFVIVAVLLIFGLNMSGVFEIGTSAVGVGSELSGKGGLRGSFFSGVLATVVATPCAAPFVGTAVGQALAMPTLAALLVFTFMALGLAAPYLLFSVFPSLVSYLPRPGAWMESFKQGMAFLLYGAAAYFAWVLTGLLERPESRNALMGLALIGVAAWIYGRWAAYHRSRRSKVVGTGSAVLALGAALVLGLYHPPSAISWETWSPERVAELRAAEQPIYIDFTADWCVTCQSNKATVFSSDRVIQAFLSKDVAALKADWTKRDATIAAELAKFGRASVPFNLVYLPGAERPVELPSILTPGIVLEALEGNASDAAVANRND